MVGCRYTGCFVLQTFYRTEVIQPSKLPQAYVNTEPSKNERQKVDFISCTKIVRVESPCHPRFPHAVMRKRAPGSTTGERGEKTDRGETEIIRTHLRDESSVVPRDDLELNPALHLLVEFTHLRNIPQSNIVDRCPVSNRRH